MGSEEPGGRTHDYWDRVEEVFAAALAAEDSARTAVLDTRCATRADLRAEVEALLAAHARAGEFITPHTLVGPGLPSSGDGGLGPGTRIGAFRLLERIAHGGMGDVYRAERVEGEFTQQVAIKMIGARLHGAETVRRFRAERQILASLQHPHIVTLIDGGLTADAQPYIVMEYIDGLPVTEFCRQRSSSLESRLRLFQQICSAVGFAHRHLVVHRDLKPGNVFVTSNGVVKVLDFGVAKLLEPHDATAAATISLLGPMTPNYASPEQVRGLPVTTACDVYALGVMLYELLSSARPYETAGRTVDEIVSIVVEREPPRPSAAPHAGLPYDPRRLRGDLDAIALKAMAKDPATGTRRRRSWARIWRGSWRASPSSRRNPRFSIWRARRSRVTVPPSPSQRCSSSCSSRRWWPRSGRRASPPASASGRSAGSTTSASWRARSSSGFTTRSHRSPGRRRSARPSSPRG